MGFLGVVVAVEAETVGLIKRPFFGRKRTLLSQTVCVRLSGMGARAARLAAEDLVRKGSTALLSWGSAGALDPGLLSGSLVVPERVLSPDQAGYSVCRSWHRQICRRLKGRIELYTGAIIQSPVVLSDPAEKSALYERSGAIAVDMESAAVARVAKGTGLPFLAIRAISDTASMTVPISLLASLDEFGRPRFIRLLKSFGNRPGDMVRLFRLGQNFRRARKTLASVMALAGPELLAPA